MDTVSSVTLILQGIHGSAAAAVLASRLVHLGYPTQVAGAEVRFIPSDGLSGSGIRRELSLDPHDSPEFAAEKIIDELAAAGWVVLNDPSAAVLDETLLHERLKRLGYIE